MILNLFLQKKTEIISNRQLQNNANGNQMKINLFIFVFVAITSAQQSEYEIPGFSACGRTFPQQGNEIIIPDSGENLTEVTSMPQLSAGEFVLRRRFSATEYHLYKGRFSSGAFSESSNLFIFQRPDNISLDEVVGMKWYKEKTGNPDLDEADIYFDNKKIYIRFFSRLFYNDGTSWKIIDAINLLGLGDKRISRQMGEIKSKTLDKKELNSQGIKNPKRSPPGMVLIPAKDSSFLMGCNNNGGDSDEKPIHTVTFTHDFWMDTIEVTQADFLSLMGFNPSYFSKMTDDRPVEKVTWFDAVLYCNKRSKRDNLDTVYTWSVKSYTGNNCNDLTEIKINYNHYGYRLPTEAEWEYACRAGTTTDYYWGNDNSETVLKQYASYERNAYTGYSPNTSGKGIQPVAHKNPNAYGLYDMSGNVWEWCNDWYEWYNGTSQINPTGPATGTSRVVRGGSWDTRSNDLRSANRSNLNLPNRSCNVIGFRCVCPRF